MPAVAPLVVVVVSEEPRLEVEPDGDELVSQLGKRRWRVMGDPEDGWWVEVDSDGNELPGDWEYDRKGGYVYCAFA